MPAAPTYAQLLALVRELSVRGGEQVGVIAEQADMIEGLRGEVAELKARLGQNPRNSSAPPSLEGLACGFQRYGAPRPKVLVRLFRWFWRG